LLFLAATLAAMLGGALWGLLPGVLKAWRNVHEVVSCIMMNYIGVHLVNWLIPATGIYNPLRNETVRVAGHAVVPGMGLDRIFQADGRASGANGGIFIAVCAAAVLYVVWEKTTLGYELKTCGYNKTAAQYAGINTNRSVITAMAASGALAGLGGALHYLSDPGQSLKVLETLASEGFNGIPAALLAHNHPIGIVFSGLFIGCLRVGGFGTQAYNFASQVVDMIISVIIYFSAFSLLARDHIQKLGLQKRQIGGTR